VPSYNFKAVVLDLFDTIVTWRPEHLPMVKWRGYEFRSSAPPLMHILAEYFGERYNLESWIDAHHVVYSEIVAEKNRDEIEITCLERFARTLRQLGVDEGLIPEVAERLRTDHMARVRRVTGASPERVDAVRRLSRVYRMGVLSNFDDHLTGVEIVTDTGVAHLFETVMISAKYGLRKPHPELFKQLLDGLALEPHEVLFVGDTPREDVLGAKRAGIPVAWIDKNHQPLPEGIPEPEITIRDLIELPDRLGC